MKKLPIFIVILVLNICNTKQEFNRRLFTTYAEKYIQNQQVENKLSVRLVNSNLQCSHYCSLNDNCHGFNLCDKKCEIFGVANFNNGLVENKDCSVYLMKQTTCSPNPCKNSGKCVIQDDGMSFKCECTDWRLYSGRFCENDLKYVITFPTQNTSNYLNVTKDFGVLDEFTICLTYIFATNESVNYQTLFNYHSVYSNNCSDVRLMSMHTLQR